MTPPLVQPTPRPARPDPAFAPHHGPAGFFNPWGLPAGRSVADLLRWQLASNPFKADKRRPPVLPLAHRPMAGLHALPGAAKVLWLGHASLLIQLDGVNVVIDPVFGRAGPVPRLAPAPVAVEELPPLHAVLLSHGHRDHLDSASLEVIRRRFPDALFAAPLGLGRSLPRGARVVELDWWQHLVLDGVALHLVPAQHWHQRGPLDRNQALWGGWVLAGSRRVYHSGDTGFFEGFAAIGEVFGGVDLAVLPMGAYEPRWFMGEQHMAPEDAVRAFGLLRAKHALAMHWGTFDLTDEPPEHGVRTLLPAALQAAGLDPRRFAVLAHGGAVAWDGEALALHAPLEG